MISVVMMTYNHESYVAQAIESVLAQETEYSFEVIVGNDCSTDKTAAVVDKLAAEDSRIIPIHQKQNLGLHRNIDNLIANANGKYIALLEGDDFWTVKDKLQKQVTFLEENPDCGQCFTSGYTFYENDAQNRIPFETKQNIPQKFNLEFYLKNQFNPPSNTKVFRKDVHPETLPDWFYTITQWDTSLHILQAIEKDIAYLNFQSLAWRRHDKAYSFSSNATGVKRYMDWIVLSKGLKEILPKQLHPYLTMEASAHAMLSIAYLKKRQYMFCCINMIKYLSSKPIIKPLKEYRDYFWRIRNS